MQKVNIKKAMLQTKHLFAAALFFIFGWQVACLPVNTSCSSGLESSTNKKIVLVIDVSASMESQDKLKKVGSVLKKGIFSYVPCHAHLGIVQFSSRGQILSNLTEVNDKSLSELVEKIPALPQGETCVSCGLKKAIEVLGVNSNATDSSVVVLITDADNSELDLDDDIVHSMEASRVQVVAAVLSDETAKLKDIDKLTERTRGFSRYIQNEHIFKELMEVLTLVRTPTSENITTTAPMETTVTSVPALNETTSSLLIVSPTHNSNENSTKGSVNLIEDTTIHQNSENVTTVDVSVDSTTSVVPVSYSAMSSVTPFEGNMTVTSPTNTTSPVAEAGPSLLHIFYVIIIVIVILSLFGLVIYCLCCKNREKRPCVRRGSYAPMPLKPIHGDQVINYASRPDSSFS